MMTWAARRDSSAPGLRRWCLLCAVAALSAFGAQFALAQNTPAGAGGGGTAGNAGDADVRRMIDSLRGAASGASRTRNLVVVPNAEREPAAAPAAAPGPAPVPAPAPAPSPGSGTSLAAAPAPSPSAAATPGLSLAIAFEPNSAQLRPESGATLGALVAAMLSPELRRNQFVIEGHTDASGSAVQNLRLSRDRAEQVRLYLVTLGVAAERLRAVGKGATEPVNARYPQAAENRRVRVLAMP